MIDGRGGDKRTKIKNRFYIIDNIEWLTGLMKKMQKPKVTNSKVSTLSS